MGVGFWGDADGDGGDATLEGDAGQAPSRGF